MRKLLLACVPAIVLAVPSQASAWCFNWNTGPKSFGYSFYCHCPFPQAGPWYQYWPYEAHFINPAPTGYPYWPSPQVLPGAVQAAPFSGGTVAPAPTPVPQPAPVKPLSFQPVGYTSEAPSYWYSR
jgi:hypothetical protein